MQRKNTIIDSEPLDTLYTGYYNVLTDGKYQWASRKERGYLNDRRPDCVTIVATNNNDVVVIDQYRPAIGQYILEFPAGKIDEGETSVEAAIREFKEETGLDLISPMLISESVFPSVGMIDECHAIVAGRFEGSPSDEFLMGDEDIHVHIASMESLSDIIGTDRAVDAKLKFYILGF